MLLLLHMAFILSVVKMLLKGEVGGHALNSHGNYIVDHGKSWNCVFEFLWEPCIEPNGIFHMYACQYFLTTGMRNSLFC